MPLVLIFIALVLLVAAYQNTVGSLFSNVATDAKGFAKWFAALALVGGLQWVPGMDKLGKWLVGLLLLVLVLRNYQNIFAGFKNLASSAGSSSTASVASPTQKYATNPSNPNITTASITGTSSSTGNVSGTQTAAVSTATNLVSQFESSLPASFGFGGVA